MSISGQFQDRFANPACNPYVKIQNHNEDLPVQHMILERAAKLFSFKNQPDVLFYMFMRFL